MVDHSFSLVILEKHGFGEYFLKWSQIFIKNQESYIMNGGVTTKYFNLNRGARQEDPISSFLLILALEITFVLFKSNINVKGLDLYGHNCLHTAYARDSIFLFRDIFSLENLP